MQIDRLREGAEIMVVILPIRKMVPELEHLAHKNTMKEINTVLLASCDGLLAAYRNEQLESI